VNLATIRDELKTLLATVTGLRTYDTVPDQVVVPAAVVAPGDPFVEFHPAMGKQRAVARFDVTVVVQRSVDRAAQDALDAYLSAGTAESSSIIDALEADRTLNGSVEDTIVERVGDYGAVTWNDVTYLGATFTLQVLATRS